MKVTWSAWYEIKNTSEELVLLARDAGCEHFGFSPDAATDKTLAGLNKGITETDLKKNLKLFRKIKGVRAGYNFFAMAPGMKFKHLLRTLYYFFKIPIYMFGKGGGVNLSYIRIEPYTEIHNIAIKEGIINNKTDLLPIDEKELKKLFFTKRTHKIIDFFILEVLLLFMKMAKSTVKYIKRQRLKLDFIGKF